MISDKLKLQKDQRNKFDFIIEDDSTFIVIAIVAKDKTKNSIVKLKCQKGIPIDGFLYDHQNDCYYYECLDYFFLGSISLSCKLKIKNFEGWDLRIPLAENVIHKGLTITQKKEVKNLRKKYPENEFDFYYIQMIIAN